MFSLLFILVAALIPPGVEAAQEIVTLDTRPGVTLKVLLLAPKVSPKGTLVMFPGGDGKDHFAQKGAGIRFGGNFLVRSSRLFVNQGFVVGIVDVPSDQARGMSDQFRTSKEHTEDIKGSMDFLSSKWKLPIFLVGTSRGTLSAAYLGATLKDPRLGGLVLTASIGQAESRRRHLSLFDVALENIALPVLFVHHKEDACWASLYADVLQLQPRLTGSPKRFFIAVSGGDPPLSEPCEAKSQHGFLGKEREVVGAITDWILGRQVPGQIGP